MTTSTLILARGDTRLADQLAARLEQTKRRRELRAKIDAIGAAYLHPAPQPQPVDPNRRRARVDVSCPPWMAGVHRIEEAF